MDDSTKSPVSLPKDVLIFVPCIGEADALKIDHVAELVCWELNQQAPDRDTTFGITPLSVGVHPVHRIERTDGAGAVTGVLDVYGYDPVAELDKDTHTRNPLARTLSVGLVAVTGALVLFTVIFRFRRQAKTRPQLAQEFILLLMLLSIFIYFGIALFALIEAVLAIVQERPDEAVLRWPQWVVLIGAVVGGLVPSFRQRITWLGERSVQMARFTLTGDSRNRLSGGVQNLVDTIAQRPEVERVHIAGYSFGSLVAMEAVYPQGGHPAPTLSLVKTLITIGSPFDLVRMVRPSYSEGRTFADDVRPKWVNIYQPIDVLGSNFRDDKEKSEATIGFTSPLPGCPEPPAAHGRRTRTAKPAPPATETRIPDHNLAWNPDLTLNAANFLVLRSLSVHAQYWDASATARSAIGMVVSEIAADAPLFRAQAAAVPTDAPAMAQPE